MLKAKQLLSFMLFALIVAVGCAKSVCPVNDGNPTANGKRTPKGVGTQDKNGRLVKQNAYHPSQRKTAN